MFIHRGSAVCLTVFARRVIPVINKRGCQYSTAGNSRSTTRGISLIVIFQNEVLMLGSRSVTLRICQGTCHTYINKELLMLMLYYSNDIGLDGGTMQTMQSAVVMSLFSSSSPSPLFLFLLFSVHVGFSWE